ncbi:Vacuolar protein sorting-associated protein 17 [Elasticomyces elasticus]|nr:Vacuolar protein sorting-associated protein 17 [Elasticomyces elasticus]
MSADTSSSNAADKRPQNLRFSRRQSERAFYEGAFRPGMDYSSLPQDNDHPAGTSPWASSPQQSRQDLTSDVPSNPLPSQASHSYPYQHPEDEQDSSDAARPSTAGSSAAPPPANGDDSGSQYQHRDAQREYQYQQQRQQQPPSGQENQRHEPQRYHGNRPSQRQHLQQYKLQAKITGLERPGRKDLITNLPKFRTTQFRDIRRTHSEFQKLADHLMASNPEAFVPAVPASVTSAGAGTDEDEARTKASMQRWLNIVCGNEILMRDEEMVFFVESDFGYSPVVRRKQPATGARRKYLKQFAPPPDDTPELLEARPIVKAFYLGAMETQQKLANVTVKRRSLGTAESSLGYSLAALMTQETHPGLAHAYRKLGKVIQSTGDYHAAQATSEATLLGDPLTYHSNDAKIVKEILTNRHLLLREFLTAQKDTSDKFRAAERMKSSSKVQRDKVDDALAQLEEAKQAEEFLKQKTSRVTTCLVQDRRKWFARTAADVRTAIREYVIRQIEAERRTLAILEQVRPDVRNIDASGGLSRLGREALPVIRRSSLASSQGPKGDAWSGVPRRPDGLNRSISGSFVTPEEAGETAPGEGGRKRAVSGASLGRLEEDDEDRVDAKNAASRLAQTTF